MAPDRDLEAAVRDRFADAGPDDVVVLADATDFEWDTVGVFGPYYPHDAVIERVGVRVPKGATNNLLYDERCLLVFRRGTAWPPGPSCRATSSSAQGRRQVSSTRATKPGSGRTTCSPPSGADRCDTIRSSNGHTTSARDGLEEREMDIRYQVVVIDAADLPAVSGFWAGVLDGSVEVEDDWHMVVDGEGVPRIGVQLAPDHVPPTWPGGPQQQQLHLDLWVSDLADAHDQVVRLGAELLQAAPDPTAEEGFQVYADPAGHPFCLCWHRTALG